MPWVAWSFTIDTKTKFERKMFYPSYRLITGDWDILSDKGTRRLPCYCTSRHLVPNAFSDRACSGAFAQNPP